MWVAYFSEDEMRSSARERWLFHRPPCTVGRIKALFQNLVLHWSSLRIQHTQSRSCSENWSLPPQLVSLWMKDTTLGWGYHRVPNYRQLKISVAKNDNFLCKVLFHTAAFHDVVRHDSQSHEFDLLSLESSRIPRHPSSLKLCVSVMWRSWRLWESDCPKAMGKPSYPMLSPDSGESMWVYQSLV